MLSTIKHIIIIIIDLCYSPFKRYVAQDVFRYGFVGGINMAFDMVLFFIFYNFIFDQQIIDLYFIKMTPYIAAKFFVFPITFISGFMLNKYVAFPTSYLQSRTQFFRYALSIFGSILLVYLILKFFVETLGFWATPSNFLTIILVAIYSFYIQKFFTFRKKND